MRTSKPIATISYNTPEYLIKKLDELVQAHKISDWMYVQHHAEVDEKKDHIHLWLRPNTLLDTMALQQHFIELDPKNPAKPLKCIDFRLGQVDDWILYALHYAPYLASKGEAREYHYLKDDIIHNDDDTYDDLYNHALKGSEWAKRYQILQQLNNLELSPAELILNGTVPLNLASQLNALTYMKTHYAGLERGKGEKHE